VPRRFWLLKTEPDVFSFDDLLAAPKQTSGWDGVRNFQARNFLRDEMKLGDGVLIYHSRIPPMAIVGVAEIAKEGHVDPTQFDPRDHHFDPKSKRESPQWFQVDVRAVQKLARPVTLEELRGLPALKEMALLQRGQRLSVQPVRKAEFEFILKLAKSRAQ
jgi:predicted RNA-binding protein with PUA-like domain